MTWSERQQAMLRELGLRLWLPPQQAGSGASSPATAAQATAPTPQAEVAVERPVAAVRAVPAAESPVARPAAPSAVPSAVPSARPPAPIVHSTGRAEADTSPVATLDWPALRAAVEGCEACGLCKTRRQTVFGVGHPQAHCMVVGEAPGEQEDAQGEPFVGAAGQLLDRMLAALGLGRADATPERQVFIANTLKCRPPRNRNPAPEELAACQPFLERQVALVQPRAILAMGRFAVTQLLGSDAPIGKLRGQVHRWRGVPVVVSYHPAYLLRQPADKAKAWDDLCLLAELLEHPATADRRDPPGG
jgi:DNA polymerase